MSQHEPVVAEAAIERNGGEPAEQAPHRSWRDLALPATLASRPKTLNGMPVPWAAAWTEEQETDYVAECPILKAPALFNRGEAGKGRPLLKWLANERQRIAMLEHRCHLCAAPLEPPWLLIDRGCRDGWYMNPWVCGSCLPYAQQVCPALRSEWRDVLEVDEAELRPATLAELGAQSEEEAQFAPETVVLVLVRPVRYRRVKFTPSQTYPTGRD